MNSSKAFFIQLLILTILMAAGLFFLNRLPVVAPHALLSWLSLAFFTVLSALMFFAGRSSASSPSKQAFTNTVLGFTMAKMFICALIVVAYHNLAQPTSKLFLLPFFSTYVVYTAFETYWMMKLARTSA